MNILKIFLLLIIFSSCCYIGLLISKKYINRVNNLKQMKIALNILKTNIEFTYQPLPEIFKEIANKVNEDVSKIFNLSIKKMKEDNVSVSDAWRQAILENDICFTKEDKSTLISLGNLLGKTDAEGQINQIILVDNFLDLQIKSANQEKNRYVKMYKTLGITVGIGIVIILI